MWRDTILWQQSINNNDTSTTTTAMFNTTSSSQFLNLIAEHNKLTRGRNSIGRRIKKYSSNSISIKCAGAERKNENKFIPMSTTDRRQLQEWNALLDIELYEYAKLLAKRNQNHYYQQRQNVDDTALDDHNTKNRGISSILSSCNKPPKILSNVTWDLVLGGKYCCPGASCIHDRRVSIAMENCQFWYYLVNCTLGSGEVTEK